MNVDQIDFRDKTICHSPDLQKIRDCLGIEKGINKSLAEGVGQ